MDPELVLVLELHSTPDSLNSSLRASSLEVLEWFDDRVVVAAATDPELVSFKARLDTYTQGPTSGAEGQEEMPSVVVDKAPVAETEAEDEEVRAPKAALQDFFDCIRAIRPFGPKEAITEALQQTLDYADPALTLSVDVQCWCPEDELDSRRRFEAVQAAVVAGGGVVLDKTLRHRVGLALFRVDAIPELITTLALLQHVRRLDVLPRANLGYGEVIGIQAADLPIVLPPNDTAPVIAVIDSGVRSGHPLLAPAVRDLLAVAGLDEARDGAGHGSFVAALALYGSLEPLLEVRDPLKPVAKLVSVRVLDDDATFPNVTLWENDLLQALDLAHEAGARIINLSIGDERRPYQPRRPTPLAAALDDFARRNDVVLVISAGNYRHTDYPTSPDLATQYATHLLDDPANGLLEPASTAIGLTVGALDVDPGQGVRPARENLDLVHVGGADMPSPITRAGPGAADMIKPDLAMPGGGLVLDTTLNRLVPNPAHAILGVDGTRSDRLLTTRFGTSMAAPLVTHIAATVLAQDPTLTANGVRALVLSSVVPIPSIFNSEDAAARKATRRLVGYGRPDAERASASSDHRAVLLAEAEIPVDSVHLYRVPVPSSFSVRGGTRHLTMALAYDPPTRASRLDYLASRMHVLAYKGTTLEAVADAYIADATDITDEDSDEVEGEGTTAGPARLRPHLLDLQPAESTRSRGAHHYATWSRSTVMTPGSSFIVAVRSVNKWDESDAIQRYALTLVLERNEDGPPLYAELRAAIEAQVTIEVEQTVEVEF